ncbi:hypothetical protein C8J57DRAFT_1602154 [Mycena rebaudengoi]|nr:hypothetical protein C8J57DRAFT_1602154 [Mycena rebaudengoi]
MQEVIALAQKALSSAIAFVNDAPLDADEMPRIVAFTIHLNFLLRGHTFSDDLRELQVQKLSLAYGVARSRVRGFDPPPICLAVDIILARMPIAWKAWKPAVARHTSKTDSTANVDPNVDLAAWLEKLDTDDPTAKILGLRGVDIDTVRTGLAQLHHCSACHSPSAVLKKCARCKKTRYCNRECQNRHWKVHRKMCVGEQ